MMLRFAKAAAVLVLACSAAHAQLGKAGSSTSSHDHSTLAKGGSVLAPASLAMPASSTMTAAGKIALTGDLTMGTTAHFLNVGNSSFSACMFAPLAVPAAGWGNPSGSFSTIFSATIAANFFTAIGQHIEWEFDYRQTGSGTANVGLTIDGGANQLTALSLGSGGSKGFGRITMTFVSPNTVTFVVRTYDSGASGQGTVNAATYSTNAQHTLAFQILCNNGVNSFVIDSAVMRVCR